VSGFQANEMNPILKAKETQDMLTKSSTLRLISPFLVVSSGWFVGDAHGLGFSFGRGSSSGAVVVVQMKEEPLAAGSDITIKSYDKEAGTYTIFPHQISRRG